MCYIYVYVHMSWYGSEISVYLLLIINDIMLTGSTVIENICGYNIKMRRKESWLL